MQKSSFLVRHESTSNLGVPTNLGNVLNKLSLSGKWYYWPQRGNKGRFRDKKWFAKQLIELVDPSARATHLRVSLTVLATRCAIADLVCMRTKLLKWSAFRPHFTQKVSFSQSWKKSCSEAVKRERKCQSDWEQGWGHASLGKWDYISFLPW